MTTTEKFEDFESQGWKYNLDGINWTSGSWSHDDLGFVTNGGGSFANITQAVQALEQWAKNWEAIKAS